MLGIGDYKGHTPGTLSRAAPLGRTLVHGGLSGVVLLPATFPVGPSRPHRWSGAVALVVGSLAAVFLSSCILTLCHPRHMHVAGDWRASGASLGSFHPPLTPGRTLLPADGEETGLCGLLPPLHSGGCRCRSGLVSCLTWTASCCFPGPHGRSWEMLL